MHVISVLCHGGGMIPHELPVKPTASAEADFSRPSPVFHVSALALTVAAALAVANAPKLFAWMVAALAAAAIIYGVAGKVEKHATPMSGILRVTAAVIGVVVIVVFSMADGWSVPL